MGVTGEAACAGSSVAEQPNVMHPANSSEKLTPAEPEAAHPHLALPCPLLVILSRVPSELLRGQRCRTASAPWNFTGQRYGASVIPGRTRRVSSASPSSVGSLPVIGVTSCSTSLSCARGALRGGTFLNGQDDGIPLLCPLTSPCPSRAHSHAVIDDAYGPPNTGQPSSSQATSAMRRVARPTALAS